MLDIPALRQLCEAATKGPWFDKTTVGASSHIADFGDVFADHDETTDTLAMGRRALVRMNHNYPKFLADASFIATAREALPAALDEIESLRAELAAARAAKPVAFGIVGDDGEMDTLRFPPKVLADEECARRNSPEYSNDAQKIVARRPFRVVPIIIHPGAGG